MAKQFVCTIDNVKFTNEQELINYIKNTYVRELNDEVSFSVYDRLKKAFPDAEINVKENKEDDIEVEMYLRAYDSNLDFKIKKEPDFSDTYYYSVFNTVEDAIKYYKENFLDVAELLVTKLKEKFNFKHIEITEFFDGYGDSRSYIGIKFITNEDKEIYDKYEFEGLKLFLERMNGHVLNVVEGECYIKSGGGYYERDKIYVGGVKIEDIIKRAKIIRVEILESK